MSDSPPMPRPVSIRDEDILRSAREIFLERGIRATSVEVALHAGVSEGSIFKRFPSKEHLFRAALRVDMDATVEFVEAMQGRVGRGTVRANLRALGGQLLAMFRLALPVMMMRWSNPDEHLAEVKLDGSPPLRLLRGVQAYLAAEIEVGRVAPSDVESLARAFLGGIQNYLFFEVIHRARAEAPTPADSFLEKLVEGLWRGCAPRRRARSRKARRPARPPKR
ncbi:MAG: TetR/AcrR family transcriptional regulator [Deltaproteobacteria bacterium]|nr:TetR/AcrR family transcriptional regulator [Deltaproteobacteria bacterium]